jgi:hypothetical protein
MPDEVPVACCLSDEELRKREATLLAQFKAALIGSEELIDGYVFHVPGDKKWIALLAELIVAERECCPFLKFELSMEPGAGPVSVRMTGPGWHEGFSPLDSHPGKRGHQRLAHPHSYFKITRQRLSWFS